MNRQIFEELLETWVNDLSLVLQTKELGAYQNGEEIYRWVQTMWFDYRDIFPNKGTYKMIRRLFIKKAAQYYNRRPYLWRNLPEDLCKEILDKANQKWISFYGELQENFRACLLWKATKTGYSKRRNAALYYVDKNLKIVSDINIAAGVVNLRNTHYQAVEILFFNPLATNNISKSKAKKIIAQWNETNYPKFKADLPTFATCIMANDIGHKIFINNCHIAVINASSSRYGKFDFVLDNEAEIEPAGNNTLTKNCYASLYLRIDEFKKINP